MKAPSFLRLHVALPLVAGLLLGALIAVLNTAISEGGDPPAVRDSNSRQAPGYAGAAGGLARAAPARASSSRRSSLSHQIRRARLFSDQCLSHPDRLAEFIAELDLPELLGDILIKDAVLLAASVDPLKTLQGIEGVPLRSARLSLILAAISAWSANDPAKAHEWVLQSPYPEALVSTTVEFWKLDPAAALTSLHQLSRAQQSSALTALVFSDMELDPDTGRKLHELIGVLSRQGDQQAASSEVAVLKRISVSDPKYVEDFLDQQQSLHIRDLVAADLALGFSNGSWSDANKWLDDYQGSAVTSASFELWKRWAKADSASLIDYLGTRSTETIDRNMIEYLMAVSSADKGLGTLNHYLKTQTNP